MEDLIDQMENQNSREALMEKFTIRGMIPEALLLEHSTRITVFILLAKIFLMGLE